MSSPPDPSISPSPAASSDDAEALRAQRAVLALHALTPRVFVTYVVLTLNVAVFALMVVTGVHVLNPTIGDLLSWGANSAPLTTSGEWWRLLTSTYLHIGLVHLAFNMFVLYQAGPVVERLVGNAGFAVMYTLAGLGGSLASVWWNPTVVSAGASGAVFGVYGCLLGFIALRRGCLPRAMVQALGKSALIFVGFNVLYGLQLSGIDMAAHVGGLVAGAVCGLALSLPVDPAVRAQRRRRVTLVGGVGVVVLALGALGLADSLEAELGRFGATERQALAAFNEMVEQSQAGELEDASFADRLESEVIAPWAAARERWQALEVAESKVARYGLIGRYMSLREDGWRALVQALRDQDEDAAARASQLQAEADATLKRMQREHGAGD